VNQVGLRCFVNSGGKNARSGSGRSFVAGSESVSYFLAESSDTAFRSAIALGANFSLADALLGRFGVGHDEKRLM
jgi:hypothetical protein